MLIYIEYLRSHIRHALLGDKLGQLDQERMTATEVRERSAQMMRILGATYGRLQTELLMPLVERAVAILRRRGEIPDIFVDGRLLKVAYKSTKANDQAQMDAENALTWFNTIVKMGDNALQNVNVPLFVKWLGTKLNVPADILQLADASNSGNTQGNIIDLSDYIKDDA